MDRYPYGYLNEVSCISFKEIYGRSKKFEDYESLSTIYSRRFCRVIVGNKLYVGSTEDKTKACIYLWCAIKAGFYLTPGWPLVKGLIYEIEHMFEFSDKEFVDIFIKTRDDELLNYKNPSLLQSELLNMIKDLLILAWGYKIKLMFRVS